MPKQKLKSLLVELDAALDSTKPSAVQTDLLDFVKRHAHAEGTTIPSEPDVLDALKIWMEEQREDHPKAANVIDQIIKTLGDIGV